MPGAIGISATQLSGVENRRSSGSLPVAFVSPAVAGRAPQSGLAWLCFLFPLIEPDRRISRIRLSEKGSRLRPRKAACPSAKFDKAQHLMQGGNGKLLGCLPSQFVLGAQPLSQPLAGMSFDRAIGLADWSKTEIVSPPNHHTIECLYHGLLG